MKNPARFDRQTARERFKGRENVRSASRLLMVIVLGASLGSSASAQGIVSQLPPDGTWVRFEGTYGQTEVRAGTATGQLEIPAWVEHVTVKSVGTEMAEFQGEQTACRWLEIVVERGRTKEGVIDPGQSGREVYKVLVPESAVTPQLANDNGVPVAFLPIVKGMRQLGARPPQPMQALALQTYPACVLVGYYRNVMTKPETVDPQIGLGAVQATEMTGTISLERADSRTNQETVVWRSADVPFGTAAWSAKITREIKDAQAPREDFKPVSVVTVQLKAQESGSNAQSELQVP
jgi:hypothetical protein